MKLRLSADGQRIVLLDVEPKSGRLGRIVSTAGTGAEVVLAEPDKGGPFRFLSWSPDGGRLLFLGAGEVLYLWDTASGKFVGPLRGDPTPEMQYLSVRVAEDIGKRWTFGWEGSETGREVSFENHQKNKPPRAWTRALWSADGTFLLTVAGLEGLRSLYEAEEVVTVVTVWDGRTGERLNALTVPRRRCVQIAFNPQGTKLAELTVDQPEHVVFPAEGFPVTAVLRVRDPATGAILHRFEAVDPPHFFAWTPDGRRLLVAGADARRTSALTCWDIETGETDWSVTLPELRGAIRSLTFRPDGKQFALTLITRKGELGREEHEAQLQVWDAGEGKMLWASTAVPITRAEPLHLFDLLSWSPDGKHVAMGPLIWNMERRARVVLIGQPEVKNELPNPSRRRTNWEANPLHLQWDREGRRFAAWWDTSTPAGWEASTPLDLWDTTTGKRIRRLPEDP